METTTETLFASLDPEAREEAIRIAARLQAHEGESAGLVAAARDAGIEDRFLREAVGQIASGTETESKLTSPSSAPATFGASNATMVTGVAVLLFAFAQGASVAVTLGGATGGALWPGFVMAVVLGAVLPRTRAKWLAPLLVLVTSLLVTAFYVGFGHLTRWHPESALVDESRIVAVEMALALVGALVTSAVARLMTPREP